VSSTIEYVLVPENRRMLHCHLPVIMDITELDLEGKVSSFYFTHI
jgi:hypothetical protein